MSAGATSTQPVRRIVPLWAALAAIGAGAWVYTVLRAREMGTGPGTMDMTAPFFAGMWVAMMAAMMLPAIGLPAAGAALRRARVRAEGLWGTLAFGAGFLVPWAAFGAFAFAALMGTERLVETSPGFARWLGVGVVATAGLYQLSPWKWRALRHCRAAMASHARQGSAFSAGVRDGAVCVGCCWALMAVLVATGVMHVPAMAGLALVIFAEKVLPRPRMISVAAGVALLAFAAAAVAEPSLLAGVQPMDAVMPMDPMPMPMDPMPMGGM
jgi:predicted metal-binding membrane protein